MPSIKATLTPKRCATVTSNSYLHACIRNTQDVKTSTPMLMVASTLSWSRQSRNGNRLNEEYYAAYDSLVSCTTASIFGDEIWRCSDWWISYWCEGVSFLSIPERIHVGMLLWDTSQLLRKFSGTSIPSHTCHRMPLINRCQPNIFFCLSGARWSRTNSPEHRTLFKCLITQKN